MCMLERGQILQSTLEGGFVPGVAVPVDRFSNFFFPVHLHTTQRIFCSVRAAFFPGERIILWVDCLTLCSTRPFLNMGLTKRLQNLTVDHYVSP